MSTKKAQTKSNHKHGKAIESELVSVLLIEDEICSKSALKKALVESGFIVTKHLSMCENLLMQIEICNPNVLVLSTNLPSDKVLKSLTEVNQLSPLPIIIFSENDSTNIIQRAIKSGVSAYVVHEILAQRV